MKPKSTLLSKVSSLTPIRKKTWLDLLSKSQLKELEELKSEYQSDRLIDATGAMPSATALWRLVRSELGVKIGTRRFLDWLQA